MIFFSTQPDVYVCIPTITFKLVCVC